MNLKILATRFSFLVLGLCASIVAPLIPILKQRLGVGDDVLGIVLLMFGIGSVFTMPFTGLLCARKGVGVVLLASGIVLTLSTSLLTVVPSVWTAVVIFLIQGASMGALDVAMNLHAVEVEIRAERPLMSGFHGFYSLGGLAGALLISLLMGLTSNILVAGVGISVCCFVLLAVSQRHFIRDVSTVGEGPSKRSFPFSVVFIGLLCAATFAAEGSVGDWSGLVIQTKAISDPAFFGWGYAAFAAMMTAGRLFGDRVRSLLGDMKVALVGGTLCCVGFVLVGLFSSLSLIISGFALVGIGAANIVPVLFSVTSRLPGVQNEVGIASVTTMGYAGFLICPPLLGVVSRQSSLSVSFFLVAAMMGVVTVLLRRAVSFGSN